MKTLKERVSELKNEIENRIINGDFEVVEIEDIELLGFFNTVHISIDGIGFRFSVSKSKTYFCQHDGPVKIRWNEYEIVDLKHLYGPIEAMQLENKQAQLKKLEDEIRSLQAK